jgi:hypothetical protein
VRVLECEILWVYCEANHKTTKPPCVFGVFGAGINFRDISTLVANHAAFKASVDSLVNRYRDEAIDFVAGKYSLSPLLACVCLCVILIEPPLYRNRSARIYLGTAGGLGSWCRLHHDSKAQQTSWYGDRQNHV